MAYDAKFWENARRRSVQPGGFGKDRAELWAKLLSVEDALEAPVTDIDLLPKHPDEHQIRLDTDRSFVMYPDGDVQGHQENLYNLLVSIFRRHPKLSYFQGFHDIITVLFLTLPPHLRLPCAEKVSLHRTRDAMGEGLEPVLGLLRFLAKLLAAVDADLARVIRRASPLPYFALSHLLTMFSHDVPTLPLIQHIFDYLLSRPPVALVYLAAAIIIQRKEELFNLNEDVDGDLGMLHSLLGALPQISDDPESLEDAVVDEKGGATIDAPITSESLSHLSGGHLDTTTQKFLDTDVIASPPDGSDSDTLADSVYYSEDDTETEFGAQQEADDTKPSSRSSVLAISSSSQSSLGISELQTHLSRSPSASQSQMFASSPDLTFSQNRPNSSSPSSSVHSEGSSVISRSKTHTGASVTLSSLLRAADDLFEAFPPYPDYPGSLDMAHTPQFPGKSDVPSNNTLAPVLSAFMGLHSVVYTWSEDPACLPGDHFAEEIVGDSSSVVKPWDPSLEVDDGDDDEKDETPNGGEEMPKRERVGKTRLLRSDMILSAGAGAVLIVAIALAMYHSRGSRSERLPLDKFLGFLGAWGAWG
ncbi:hypothetical protein D9757_004176 [Collybiopsis confluens]|uniref:Rab-GAP TBC domain-containing protein n=1 Tax=Collybiopsis confluens TaxID=2823264 RepID=A0A8H5HU41_9AGAR|nr:hypothetical protein D9757_004176 [Collybiopsis confluens]